MNKEFTDLIIKWVDKAGGAIEQGIEFTIQQAPELFEQYMMIQFIESFYAVVVALVFAIVFIVSLVINWKAQEYDGQYAVTTICSILFIISIWIGSWNASEMFKIRYAPKAYMMIRVSEYMSCKELNGAKSCKL